MFVTGGAVALAAVHSRGPRPQPSVALSEISLTPRFKPERRPRTRVGRLRGQRRAAAREGRRRRLLWNRADIEAGQLANRRARAWLTHTATLAAHEAVMYPNPKLVLGRHSP